MLPSACLDESIRHSDHMQDDGGDTRPGLVILSNCVTPYRIHLHKLIAAGIPEFRLHTVISHGLGDFVWSVDVPPEIHLVNVSAPGEHPDDNPLFKPLIEWRKSRQLVRYLEANRTQAVVFNGYRHLSYLRLMKYCRRRQIPFFVRNDSNIRSEPQLSPLKGFIKRKTYDLWMKWASGIFSMGELGDQFFIKYGADRRRLYRVPYWPDYDAFAAVDQEALARFQRKFGLDRGRRCLMFSGRLVQMKRVDLIIDAFAKIAAQRPEWDLLIVGEGVLGESLRRRVPEALQNRVVWTGFLERGELALAYHSADVLVLPSETEPWAVVVQEAMAAGLPVVASDVVGAAHELVADGVSGRIFESQNCDALRAAIEDVTHPNRISSYKQQATIALQRYREKVDPVAEIRRALRDAAVLSVLQPENR
jgi:glycosyltransferase involved in cell wall biosynthesis